MSLKQTVLTVSPMAAVAAAMGKMRQTGVSQLDIVFSKLMAGQVKRRAEKEPSAANKRATARYKAKLKANRDIPSGHRETRQQRRRAALLRGRQVMTIARKEAMAQKLPGGSAMIRTPADVDQYLGG